MASSDSKCWQKVIKKIWSRILQAGDAKNNLKKKIVRGYAMAKDIIYSLWVCNDSTVRRIKLVTDFLHLLHKEENLQNYAFVVEDNFRKIPNLRKCSFQFV